MVICVTSIIMTVKPSIQPLKLFSTIYNVYAQSKDQFMKCAQYTALLVCWVYEREQRQRAEQHFIIYKKIFTCRRLFRLGEFINFLPDIESGIIDIKKELSWENLTKLLTSLSRFAFFICDNIAVCMQMVKSKYYHLMRRVSFSILLIALIASIIYNLARLNNTFEREAKLKKHLVCELTPKQFLVKLSEVDWERRALTYVLISKFGDLLPTLERMNLPQVLLKTRINKLTVGFFGLVGAISEIISVNMMSAF